MAVSTPAAQAADRYRVEVLVLQHLNSTQEASELNMIRDYSAALDFLAPVPDEDESALDGCEPAPGEDKATPEIPAENPELLADEAEELLEEEIDPNAVVHVTEMGPEMQEAWRRLRLSGPFRPLQFLAWEQGSEEPFPDLRIHDQEVVFLDDPYADLREIAIYEDDFTTIKQGAENPDCIPANSDPFPEPTLYYALDGTVSLKRSRFLHLNLDLQLREALANPEVLPEKDTMPAMAAVNTPRAAGSYEASALANEGPKTYRVHALEQSRQVRSARMEYFDGPTIGVLAWITTIPLEESSER